MTRIKPVTSGLALLVFFAGSVSVRAQSTDVVPPPGSPQTMDFAGFQKQVQPFFNKYCIECHTPEGVEAEVPLDVFKDLKSLQDGIPNLDKALFMLRSQKMPPRRKAQPTESDRKAVVEWLEAFTSGVDCSKPEEISPGRVTLRRLNRAEYNNTIRDLLAIEFRPADSFPVDDAGYGFDNIGDVLSIAPVLMEKYLTAAEAVLKQAIFAEPVVPPMVAHWDANIAEGSVPKTAASPVGSTPAGGNLYSAELTNGRLFYHNGEIYTDYDFPMDGTYVLRFRGFGTPGTSNRQRPQVQFYIDGQEVSRPVNVNDDQRNTKMYPANAVKITAGRHRVSLAYINGGTKEEYDAAVEAARLAELIPATQPATQPIAQADARGGAAPAAGARRGGRGRAGPPPIAPSATGRAILGVHFFEVEGPLEPTPDRMPESYRRVMVAQPSNTTSKAQAAEQIIRSFASKAYRRPVKDDEVQRLMAFWRQVDSDGTSFEQSIQDTLSAVLSSPHFLYRVERDPTEAEGPVRSLDEYELASRLSYFLWSSMPDTELFALAEQGKLRANLDAQITRMLQDPKSRALVDNFAGQWLQLRMMETIAPDPTLFPEFDPSLRVAMATETRMLFESIMKEDRSVLDLIDANFTFLNERLAKHYGVDGVSGDAFQRVQLASADRGGILTHGSILTITSYPNRTSPVQRGKWVLENLLDAAPPPPPPSVPALQEQGQLKGTLRQRMEQHRENPTCASCHEQMDAIGFGLENFDAIGRWRTMDGDSPVDASGSLPGNQAFNGPAELKRIIKAQDTAFARSMTDKMLTYAIGRGTEKYDRCTIDEIVSTMKQNGYRFSVLVREIVHSDPFQKRSAK